MTVAFRFRLQRVLDLRVRAEEAAARALAAAQDAEAAAQAELAALEQRRAELAVQADPAQAGGASIGALRTMGFLLGRMDEQVTVAAAQAVQAGRAVGDRHAALQLAWRDRRTLDRLREKHLDEWKGAMAALDRQTMDDIALARFGQQPDGARRRATED